MAKRENETKVHARDDAGEWSELNVTPDEYITLKASGIKTIRNRRDRIVARMRGQDPYEFIDKVFEMRPERQQELRKKSVDERKYLKERLEDLGQRRARALADYDKEIEFTAERLKEIEITIGVLDEVIQDEIPEEAEYSGKKPISELSDDDVPFDDGFVGDATYFENAEAVNARDRILDELWERITGGPVY